MSTIISVNNLTKDFKEVKAVDNLSFQVNEGEVYGFLGQNGAGKSTTIRMLLSLITPSAGDIEIFGLNLKSHRKEILKQTGAIIERPDLYKYLSAFENMRLFASLSRVKLTNTTIKDQLAKVGLAERAYSKVKTFSQGMKQRLGLACALVHNPGLLILDEPSNGLDPQGIADMRRMIQYLSKVEKKTLVVSSHLLSEMEMVADSMLIINKGRKVVEGRVSALLNPAKTAVELITNSPDALAFIKKSEWGQFLKLASGERICLEFNKNSIPVFNQELVANGIEVQSLRPLHSLEEYFLSQTKG
ncbi:MAG TPA: ABC transporter ATP-binding protein [Chitinophagaceae bacterium]|nr:ABC transporter ATP-binding protein [Chitinophagaceae bacterium]